MALESTEKEPMACQHSDNRPLPPEHPKSGRERKKEVETVEDLLPLGFSPCSNLQGGLFSFSSSPYLFICSISEFISNSPKGKHNIKPNAQIPSEWIDNDSRSTCEWVTYSLLEETDYCNTAPTITTMIIPFSTQSSNCIMSHCILRMLSKTGFRYANYLGKK